MPPGKYPHYVTIKAPTPQKQANGEVILDWSTPTTFTTAWAEKIPETSRRIFAAKQAFSEINAVFRIPYQTGITKEMRVVCDGEAFDILVPPVDPDGRKKELHLMCREVD